MLHPIYSNFESLVLSSVALGSTGRNCLSDPENLIEAHNLVHINILEENLQKNIVEAQNVVQMCLEGVPQKIWSEFWKEFKMNILLGTKYKIQPQAMNFQRKSVVHHKWW